MIKQALWHGKTESEAKAMDMKEFMKSVPARSRRSLQRGFTDAQKALMKRLNVNAKNIKTHCRDIVIIPIMLGQTIRVHNGKEFLSVIVTIDMLGHYLGEFALTRKPVKHSAAGIGATRSSKAVSAR